MVYLNELPQDVLCILFGEILDGKSLLQCELVCKRWRELIIYLEKFSLWKRIMFREAGLTINTFTSMILSLANNVSLKDDCASPIVTQRFWKRLYKIWNLTLQLQGPPVEIKFDWESSSLHFLPADICISYITCIRLVETKNGKAFITGHRDGHCILWNESDIKATRVILTHEYGVKAIEVVHVYCGENSHQHIISASLYGSVKEFCLNNPDFAGDILSGDGRELVSLKVYGMRLELQYKNSSSCIINLKLREADDCKLVMDNIVPGREENQIVNSHRNGIRGRNSWIPPKEFYFKDDLNFHVDDNRNLIVKFCSDNVMYQATYDTQKSLGGHVTAVQIYGGILALGYSNGHLCIYKFTEDADLLTLNLNLPFYSIKLCRNWISTIAIMCFTTNDIVIKVVANCYFVILDLRWNKQTLL